MKIHVLHKVLPFLFFLITQIVTSQEHHEEHEFKHFRISASIGHGYIPEVSSQSASLIIIPSIGVELQYWFNSKWGVAAKNDLEIANYIVEPDDGSSNKFIRNYPVIVSTPVLYKPWEDKKVSFFLGPGIEFEGHENFSVLRMGVGFEFEVGKHWDFAPEVIYDLKNEIINSLTVGIGIGRRF